MSSIQLKKGFSLVELLVVVAIIGVLAAIGTVGYGNYVTQTRIKVNATNDKNVGSYGLKAKDIFSFINIIISYIILFLSIFHIVY